MAHTFAFLWLTTSLAILLVGIYLRILQVLPSTNPRLPLRRTRGQPSRILVVLGSGGHTGEMMSMIDGLDHSLYTHRTYVVSSGDSFSATKAEEYEIKSKFSRPEGDGAHQTLSSARSSFDVAIVPRARKIHQSIFTTPFTAIQCFIGCIKVLRSAPNKAGSTYPDLILCNGPGTAVCVVYASLLLRLLGLTGTRGMMRTIYVESWARVTRLSLSGRLLLQVVDRFLVQWERLDGIGGRAEYLGVLV